MRCSSTTSGLTLYLGTGCGYRVSRIFKVTRRQESVKTVTVSLSKVWISRTLLRSRLANEAHNIARRNYSKTVAAQRGANKAWLLKQILTRHDEHRAH